MSVIVPVFNEERLLADAIGCIRRQGDPNAEIVVVDDGSTDKTPEILERLSRERGAPLHVLRQENSGPGAARNAGVHAAHGEILAFLDADDLWSAGWLHAVRTRLDAEPEALLLGYTSLMRIADDSGSGDGWNPPEAPVLAWSFGAMALQRSTWEAIGGVDASLRFGEDLAFSMVARERGVPVAVLPTTTQFYRLHGHNSVKGRGIKELNVMRVLHESLRRRASPGDGVTHALPPVRRPGVPESVP